MVGDELQGLSPGIVEVRGLDKEATVLFYQVGEDEGVGSHDSGALKAPRSRFQGVGHTSVAWRGHGGF